MLVGAPQAIAADPSFRESVALLLPAARLDAFAAGAGFDLRTVEVGLVAGFDLGTLYLLRPPRGTQARIVQRFRERIVSGEQRLTPHPTLERIAGIVNDIPQTLISISDHLVAIAVGDPTLARVVEAFARKRLVKSPTALRGAALSAVAKATDASVATFYAPGPFEGDWAKAARGLLGGVVALSICAQPAGPDHARLQLDLAGDFPATGADDLLAGFADLSTSSTGRLLALDQLGRPPEVHERPGRLVLDLHVALPPVARGLRAAVMADVWEILELPSPPSGRAAPK